MCTKNFGTTDKFLWKQGKAHKQKEALCVM